MRSGCVKVLEPEFAEIQSSFGNRLLRVADANDIDRHKTGLYVYANGHMFLTAVEVDELVTALLYFRERIGK